MSEILKIDYKWLKHSWIRYTEDISVEVLDENRVELYTRPEYVSYGQRSN